MTDELLTISEAAEILNCSTPLIRRWCANGEMPAIKKGKTWLIKSSDLEKHPPIGEWGRGKPRKKPTS